MRNPDVRLVHGVNPEALLTGRRLVKWWERRRWLRVGGMWWRFGPRARAVRVFSADMSVRVEGSGDYLECAWDGLLSVTFADPAERFEVPTAALYIAVAEHQRTPIVTVPGRGYSR